LGDGPRGDLGAVLEPELDEKVLDAYSTDRCMATRPVPPIYGASRPVPRGETDLADVEMPFLAQIEARLRPPVGTWPGPGVRWPWAAGAFQKPTASWATWSSSPTEGLDVRGLDIQGRQMHFVVASELALLTGDAKYDALCARVENDDPTPSVTARRVNLAPLYAERGELDRAARQYSQLPPWRTWNVPRFAVLSAPCSSPTMRFRHRGRDRRRPRSPGQRGVIGRSR
jgi:hypothetical protein